MLTGPFETTPIGAYPTKGAWDATAAELVATMLRRWRLTAVQPLAGGEAGAVLVVRDTSGEESVLKVGYPHVEAVYEAVVLELWGAALAPRVLRQDPWTWSMLLERVRPGVPLSAAAVSVDEALAAAARLYARFSAARPPAGIPSLEQLMLPFVDVAERSLDEFALGRDAEELVIRGLEEYRALAASQSERRLLHGDYNPGNVLASGEGWRVIDPKPMLGDPAFDLAPLVDQVGSPWSLAHPEAVLMGRLESVCTVVGCDQLRSARWAFARAALDVTWYAEDGERAAVAHSLRRAAGWRAISGL